MEKMGIRRGRKIMRKELTDDIYGRRDLRESHHKKKHIRYRRKKEGVRRLILNRRAAQILSPSSLERRAKIHEKEDKRVMTTAFLVGRK